MKTILLGPNGQLGTDIRGENERSGAPLALRCVGRAELDLADIPAAIAALDALDFDCLINCSSYHRTDEAEGNAQLAFTINTHLVEKLAQLCARRNARMVHISTDYVFGGMPADAPLRENAPKAPVNIYGASKAMGEDLALATGADLLILRVASLFGVAGASGKGGNFVETMIRLARQNGLVKVVADQTMSPTATVDIAAALLAMLRAGVPAGVWHVVNSGAATWYDFACAIIAGAGIDATVTPLTTAEFPTAARRPTYSALDNGKTAAAIGPLAPWEEALERYLAAKGHTDGTGRR